MLHVIYNLLPNYYAMSNNFSNLGGLGFWIVGYGLAFGDSNSGIIGTSYFGAIGLPLESYSNLFFQVIAIMSEFTR